VEIWNKIKDGDPFNDDEEEAEKETDKNKVSAV
jgi:hypothetical protein